MKMTWCPISAKQAPVTEPIYPVPTTEIFIKYPYLEYYFS
jgi:hypothetical protein